MALNLITKSLVFIAFYLSIPLVITSIPILAVTDPSTGGSGDAGSIYTNPTFDPGPAGGMDSVFGNPDNTVQGSPGVPTDFVDPAASTDNNGDSAGLSQALPIETSSSNFCIGGNAGFFSFYPSMGSSFYNIWRINPSQLGEPGLLGIYFDNIDLSRPTISRVDREIKFNWGDGSPTPMVNPEDFSVKWIGKLKAETGGPHTFTIKHTGGIKLYIDDQVFMSSIGDKFAQDSKEITLEAGKTYNIRLEYSHGKGPAQIELATAPNVSFFPTFANGIFPSLIQTSITEPNKPLIFDHGIFAAYFENKNLSDTPAVFRSDPNIDFMFNEETLPDEVQTASNYSIRWTGKVKAKTTGQYTFYVQAKDGIRLKLGSTEERLIDDWKESPATRELSKQVSLIEGQMYDLVLEHFLTSGDGTIKLLWEGPGVSKEVVPSSHLFNLTNINFKPGLHTQYFDNSKLIGANTAKTEAKIDFDWGSGPPDPLIGSGEYSVRFVGKLKTRQAGEYTFFLTGGGESIVGMKLDNNPLISMKGSSMGGDFAETASKVLEENQLYPIELIYKHTAGNGKIRLSWKKPGDTREEVIPVGQFLSSILFMPITLDTGLIARYFDNWRLNASPLSRIDGNINFTTWGENNPPDPSINPNSFSVKWTGKLKAPKTGSYTLIVRHNDGVSLNIDKQSAFSGWKDQKTIAEDKVIRTFQEGKTYNIALDYYYSQPTSPEDKPFIRLSWIKPGETQEEPIPAEFFFHTITDSSPIFIEDSTAQSNALSFYQISAVGSAGAVNSNFYSISGNCTSPILTTAIASCSITSPGNPEVNLEWTPVAGTVEYRVYRSDNPLVSTAQIQAPATTYTDQDVLPNTEYSYAITSYNPASGESPITSWKPIRTPSGGSKTPTCPTVSLQGRSGCFTPQEWQSSQPITSQASSSVGVSEVTYRLTNLTTSASKESSASSQTPGQNPSIWEYLYNGTDTAIDSASPELGGVGSAFKIEAKVKDIAQNSSGYADSPPLTINYQSVCLAPWIKTSGGDVHSNIKIDTPGGP